MISTQKKQGKIAMIKISDDRLTNPVVTELLESLKKNIMIESDSKALTYIYNSLVIDESVTQSDFYKSLLTKEIKELLSDNRFAIKEYYFICLIQKFVCVKKNISNSKKRAHVENALKMFELTHPIVKKKLLPHTSLATPEEIQNGNNYKLFLDRYFATFLSLNKVIQDTLKYDYFIKDIRVDLIKAMDMTTCPICNLHHYEVIINDGKKISAAEIDHYLSKSLFPLFSLSFGNMIPTCKPCNQTFKHVKNLRFLNPRENGFSDKYTFFLKGFESNLLNKYDKIQEGSIELTTTRDYSFKSKMINNSIKELHILDRYNQEYPIDEVNKFLILFKKNKSTFYQKSLEEITHHENDYIDFIFLATGLEISNPSNWNQLEDHPRFINKVMSKLKSDLIKRYSQITD